MNAHDRVCRAVARELISRGYTVALEVGIPHGRLDIAVVDCDRPVWLFEVKSTPRATPHGIHQLRRYAADVGGDPRLTLVCSPIVHRGPFLRNAAAAHGIDLWALPVPDYAPAIEWSYVRDLPYFDPSSWDGFRERMIKEAV